MSSELSQVITTINSEINNIIERNLLPHFETIRIIENLLKQLPEFKRLEQENADLKKRLSLCNDMKIPVPVLLAPTTVKNEIKLEIVEPPSTRKIVSENELYSTVNLLNTTDNKLQNESDEDIIEVEVEEEEVIEVDESEEEEEEVEEEEDPLEEDGVEGAEPFEEEEVEEEEEEVEEEEEEEEDPLEEEDGVEGLAEQEENPPEEDGGEGENPPEEDGGEGENPPEEEVFIVEIKGRGRFYTSNETNGDIYQIEGEDDVGDVVGKFVNKVATFIV